MTYKQTAWSLQDLFSRIESPELEAAFKTLEEQVAEFGKIRPQLKADVPVGSFLEIVKDSEGSTRLAHKLYAFAGLSFAADTQYQAIKTCWAASSSSGLRSRTAPCSSAFGGRRSLYQDSLGRRLGGPGQNLSRDRHRYPLGCLQAGRV